MIKGIWAIIAVSSVLLFSGMYAYGVAGNTTVENIGVNPATTFIEIEVSDPDGLADLIVMQTGGIRFGVVLFCAPTITTSVILEFVASRFPATITVEDCTTRPGDVTEWAINSAGVVRCTSGSCLTPPEQTESLNEDVQSLIDDGTLTVEDGEKLTKSLDKIIKAINNGDTVTACDQLNKLIKDTQKLIDRGDLDSLEGQPIIDAAENIKSGIPC